MRFVLPPGTDVDDSVMCVSETVKFWSLTLSPWVLRLFRSGKLKPMYLFTEGEFGNVPLKAPSIVGTRVLPSVATATTNGNLFAWS